MASMSFSELFPAINMYRADKLRLMQLLVIDLAHGEGVLLLSADAEYPILTLLHAFKDVDMLFQMLKTHQANM
jgi:hypothetical protein